jgi:hypothetical protein
VYSGSSVGGVWVYEDAVEDDDLLGTMKDRPRVSTDEGRLHAGLMKGTQMHSSIP